MTRRGVARSGLRATATIAASVVLASAAMFALMLGAHADLSFAAGDEPPEYQVAGTCGYCHDTQYQEFSGSIHSKAAIDPVYRYEVDLGNEQTDGFVGPFCLKCHAPIGHMRGEIAPPTGAIDGSALSEAGLGGVSCDFCHTVAAPGEAFPGNADFVADPGLLKRGPYDDSVSPGHDTAFSPLHTTSEFCGICHDVSHPVNGLQLEATYTEWKEGPYAAEGVQCQGCHMVPIPGPAEPPAGKASVIGPDRERVWLMDFQGANAALGRPEQAAELLRSAAALDLTVVAPERVEAGTPLTASVTVSNVGAGHYLPTGLTDLRNMWLEVAAVDADGTAVEVGRVEYRTVFADEHGDHDHVPVWFAASVYSDRRIPPRGSVEETVEFVWPEGVRADARLVATLKYQSFPQELADKVGLDIEVPVVVMTQVEQAVPVAGGESATLVWLLGMVGVVVVVVAAALLFTRRRGAGPG